MSGQELLALVFGSPTFSVPSSPSLSDIVRLWMHFSLENREGQNSKKLSPKAKNDVIHEVCDTLILNLNLSLGTRPKSELFKRVKKLVTKVDALKKNPGKTDNLDWIQQKRDEFSVVFRIPSPITNEVNDENDTIEALEDLGEASENEDDVEEEPAEQLENRKRRLPEYLNDYVLEKVSCD